MLMWTIRRTPAARAAAKSACVFATASSCENPALAKRTQYVL